MTVRVSVAGASGAVGGELLRLLAAHPRVELAALAAYSQAGMDVGVVHPELRGVVARQFDATDPKQLAEADLVFLAVPRGESGRLAASIPAGVRVVDLGPDFRLADPNIWRHFYESEHPGHWPLGLPEAPGARPVIRESERVAAPSCYATGVLLGLMPLVAEQLADPGDITVTILAGASGGGQAATRKGGHAGAAIVGALRGYQLGGEHGSIPEVEQQLTAVTGSTAHVSLTPVLAPMPRGVLAVCSIPVGADVSREDLRVSLQRAYQEEAFVRLAGGSRTPSTVSVVGTNQVHIQVAIDQRARRAVVVTVLDNLLKGAAGQAIQVANLMLGFDESDGLIPLRSSGDRPDHRTA